MNVCLSASTQLTEIRETSQYRAQDLSPGRILVLLPIALSAVRISTRSQPNIDKLTIASTPGSAIITLISVRSQWKGIRMSNHSPRSPSGKLLFNAPCKTGRLQVDAIAVRVVAPFNQLVWSVPRAGVTGVSQQRGAMTTDLIIHTRPGSFSAPFVANRFVKKFLALFPGAEVGTPLPIVASQPLQSGQPA